MDKASQGSNKEKQGVSYDGPFMVLDGSIQEGGGQLLRNSISLSGLLSKPIKVVNIRAKRKNPGLAAQHLEGIKLVQKLYNAKLTGGYVTSTDISFTPSSFQPGKYEADTQTAGSICLLIQVSLPCLIFGSQRMEVTYKGGTNAINAPQTDYITKVFQPVADPFGFKFELVVNKRGFYPKGGGVVTLKTSPVKSLSPKVILDRGEVTHVSIFSFVAGKIPHHVAQRMNRSAKEVLVQALDPTKVKYEETALQETRERSFGDGTGIIIVAKTSTGCILGGSSLGEFRKKAEVIGKEAAEELVRNINWGGCVDEWAQDQIILFMALAKGKSRVKTGPLTSHTTTSIHFAEILTGVKFSVTKVPKEQHKSEGEDTYIIECEGMGYQNPNIK